VDKVPEAIGVIAGKGNYPRVFIESARLQGVRRIFAVAMRGETDPIINRCADEVVWLRVGQLQAMLDAFRAAGVKQAVMVGQITPTALFRVRPDAAMVKVLKSLRQRNAHTIFGAVGEELKRAGVELAPASLFMESTMPAPGPLGSVSPSASQLADIELGTRVAKATSGLEIGQTVVVKEGTVLAVEAFEGTNDTIRRAGELGGAGAVVVKVAKRGHDMRFDIPVVGDHTFKTLKKIRAGALAVEAGRTILLDRERLVRMADELRLAFVAIQVDGDDRHE